MKERNQSGQVKEQGTNWKQYVEARRANVTADGKSRSKGYPQATGGKQGDIQNKYRSFLRPTELKTATTEKMKVAEVHKAPVKAPEKAATKAPKPVKTEGRKERLVKAFDRAAANFKKVMNRQSVPAGKTKEPTAERKIKPLPAGGSKQAAQHSTKQKKVDAGIAAQKTES